MKLCSLLFLVVFDLYGCQTPASKINAVHIGMSKAEVFAVMGPPVSVTADQTAEYLNYSLLLKACLPVTLRHKRRTR